MNLPHPPKEKKKFLQYIHYYRGIAIVATILGHVLMAWPEGSVVKVWLDIIFQNATVSFIFIAGYLFQHLSYKFDFKDYLTKKWKNVLIPYLIISVPTIAYRIIFQDAPGFTTDIHPDFLNWPIWQQVAWYITRGAHLQPFWFIPMIVLYYMLAPVLVYIDRHPRWYWVLVPLTAVSLLIDRGALSNTFSMAAHFLSVYMFGAFISHYNERFLKFADKNGLLMIGLTIAVTIANRYVPVEYFAKVNYIQKMLVTFTLLYVLWKYESKIHPYVGTLGDLSFGIFFVHYFYVLLLRNAFEWVFGRQMTGTFLSWLICSILVVVLTVITLNIAKWVLQKRSRYVVGC